jgi:hypothetical protein
MRMRMRKRVSVCVCLCFTEKTDNEELLSDCSLRNRLIDEETKTLAASQAEREAKNQLQELVRSTQHIANLFQ